MFIAVGDDEAKNPLAEDQYKDIDMEAHLLFTESHGCAASAQSCASMTADTIGKYGVEASVRECA